MFPPWLPTAALTSAAIGLFSHYTVWIRFEVDGKFHQVVAAALILQPLALLLLRASGLALPVSFIVLCILQTSYLVPLFISVSVYRLFLHPTRKFPGPYWARLSSWWKVATFARSEKAYLDVHKLHQLYGDVVRIGMYDCGESASGQIITISALKVRDKYPSTTWKRLRRFTALTLCASSLSNMRWDVSRLGSV